jgi:L-alanine-DL-glutamate epimerase-like enolase superfamily enzyme
MALVHPEIPNTTPPIYECGYDDQLETIDEDGYIDLPEGPGLGVEYNWEFIERNKTGQRVYE